MISMGGRESGGSCSRCYSCLHNTVNIWSQTAAATAGHHAAAASRQGTSSHFGMVLAPNQLPPRPARAVMCQPSSTADLSTSCTLESTWPCNTARHAAVLTAAGGRAAHQPEAMSHPPVDRSARGTAGRNSPFFTTNTLGVTAVTV